MRILGVVTLVSPNGEYGGPVRVAVNQLRALRERGHDVVLAGAHRGYGGSPPDRVEGIPARLYPARRLFPAPGFSGLVAPGLWRALHRHAREFDIVHVHATRDLITLVAARIAQHRGSTTLLQTHGMIDESRNPLAVPADLVLTRPALRRAATVLFLTPEERDSLAVVSRGAARLAELPNGVPPAAAADTARPAASAPHMLYLARLAARKRPTEFVDAAAALADEFGAARFTLVGPDEGEGDRVRGAIRASGHEDRIRWEGPVAPERTAAWMRAATAYVLPSVDEPYPMAVLEAMAAGLPVVVTDTCGLAPFVREHDAGIVIAGDRAALVGAMRTLLGDPVEAAAMGARGRRAVGRHRSMGAIAERLEALYR